MSNFYYKIDDDELHLSSNCTGRLAAPFYGDWPWTGNPYITRVIIDGPIQLPPDASGFFSYLSKLKSIDGLENLDTSQVTDMSGMFYNCKSLIAVDLSGFNTSKVTNMYGMFYNCSSLKSAILADQRIIAELPDGVAKFYTPPHIDLAEWYDAVKVSNTTPKAEQRDGLDLDAAITEVSASITALQDRLASLQQALSFPSKPQVR